MPGGFELTRPESRGGATPMLPKKGQRDHDSRGELCDHAPTIEWDDPGALRAVAIGREKPNAAVVAVRQREVDAEDPHLEHVARIGSLHKNGPRENVSAGALIGDRVDDVAQGLLHVGWRDARRLQAVGAVRDERLDQDGVARGDAEHRRRRGAVVAVGDGARRGGEPMEVLGGERRGGGREQQESEKGSNRRDHAENVDGGGLRSNDCH